jgi:hypothetical protein
MPRGVSNGIVHVDCIDNFERMTNCICAVMGTQTPIHALSVRRINSMLKIRTLEKGFSVAPRLIYTGLQGIHAWGERHVVACAVHGLGNSQASRERKAVTIG